jgi:hypothetical protein
MINEIIAVWNLEAHKRHGEQARHALYCWSGRLPVEVAMFPG